MNAIRLFNKGGPKDVETVHLFNEGNEEPNSLSGVRQRSADHRPSSEGKRSPKDVATWPRRGPGGRELKGGRTGQATPCRPLHHGWV